MEKTIMLLTMLISFLAINISYAVFPYISRKTLSFGIAIPEDIYNEPKINSIRKNYRGQIIVLAVLFITAIIIITFIPSINADRAALISSILIFVNLIANSLIYLQAHNKMKVLKSQNKWHQNTPQLITIETGFRNRKFRSSPLWFAIYFLVIATTIAISFLVYDTIPNEIPMKFNTAGQVIRFVEKTHQTLLYIPLVQLFITLVFIFVYYSISKAKQQIDPGNPHKTLQQTVIFRYRWSLFINISGILLLVMLSFIQFAMIGFIQSSLMTIAAIVVPLVIVITAVFLSILTGQSGNRVKIKNPNDKASIVRDDDSYWKFGVLYYNPEDPAIFIEKRFGIGWTINWGRKLSWLILLGLIILIGGFVVLSFMITG